MPLADSRPQPVDEQIVLAEHLHVRMLDELPGRAGREQGFALLEPRISDRVPAGDGFEVARFGVEGKIAVHEISSAKLSDFEVAGCPGPLPF